MPTSYIIPPFSVACLTQGQIYPSYYVGGGGSVQRFKGIGIASGTNPATGELAFQIPRQLPSGNPYLAGYAISPVTGVASYDILWNSVSSGENPATATLFGEGTGTITWAGGESGLLKSISTPLDADTIAAGDMVTMRLRFISPWSLLQTSNWRFWIEYIQ